MATEKQKVSKDEDARNMIPITENDYNKVVKSRIIRSKSS